MLKTIDPLFPFFYTEVNQASLVFMKKKRSKRENRAKRALIGLIELYLKTGRPVGSETLKEHGFDDLSSATLRNYFVDFEKEGLVLQPHTSGGRIPTNKAYRLYAEEVFSSTETKPEDEERFSKVLNVESRSVTTYLHRAGEILSEVTGYPAFLSSVRFDHDFILDVRFIAIDNHRVLAALISHFGQIFTETLFVDKKVSLFSLKRIEAYFQAKLKKESELPPLNHEEKLIADKFYSELMVRYLTLYYNFSEEDVFRSGFSRLLNYPEFSDPISLSAALALFENTSQMRRLLADGAAKNSLGFWIGSELAPFGLPTVALSAIVIPYHIHHVTAGAIGIIGPTRMPYSHLFGTLRYFSTELSRALTKTLYKFKLSYRHPRSTYLLDEERIKLKLLESKEIK